MSLEKQVTSSTHEKIALPVDRIFVRAIAEKNFEALKAAAVAGKNTHQLALDQSDEIDAYVKTLSTEDQIKFSTLYEQELNAVSQASIEETNAINSRAVNHLLDSSTKTNNVSIWISLIVFFIVLISFVRMMKS